MFTTWLIVFFILQFNRAASKRILISVLDVKLPSPPEWYEQHGATLSNITKEYCKQHNYDYFEGTENLFPYANHIWSKFGYNLIKLDEGYDLILNLDSDTLIMNADITIEELDRKAEMQCGDYAIAKAKDSNGFNSGVYLLRNTPLTREILKKSLALINATDLRFMEQSAFTNVVESSPIYSAAVCVVHQRLFNAYPDNQEYAGERYHWGDFLIHFVHTGKIMIKAYLPWTDNL